MLKCMKVYFQTYITKMGRTKTFILLALILAFGYFLRVRYLPGNVLTFGYDQGRDHFQVAQIASGHLKIQGPPASTPGLNHGVLYFYALTPAYLISQGNPVVSAYWIALINISAGLVVFILTFVMTKKVAPALLAAFLYVISFEATQYATWLSNPTLAVFTVPLMYLGLWLWIDPQIKSSQIKMFAPVLAALGLGLSIQSEIFLAYHFIPLLLTLLVFRKKITRRHFILFVSVLLLALISYLICEFRFGFQSIKGIKLLLTQSSESLAYTKSVGDYLVLYLNQIGRIFAFNIYPGNVGYAGVVVILLGIYGLYQLKRSQSSFILPFLSFWLFAHVWVVTLGGTSTPFLMVGIGPAVSILIAYWLFRLWTSKYHLLAIGLIALIVFGNLSSIIKQNKSGSTLFSIQKDMLLSNELAVVDYTYQSSSGNPFSINTLTSPLWINTTWSYLYNWYGVNKYGFLPDWHGRDQSGILGGNLKQSSAASDNLYYFIIEPLDGIPSEYLATETGLEDTKSKLIEEKHFGSITVQKRLAI